MASRYGRNKKRAHREEIARLGEAVGDLGRRLGDLRADRDDVAAKFAAIVDRVQSAAPHSVVLRPKTLRHEPSEWVTPDRAQSGSFRRQALDDPDQPLTMPELLRVPLGRVRIWIDSVARSHEFQTRVHFAVPAPEGQQLAYTYLISDVAADLRDPGVVECVLDRFVAEVHAHYGVGGERVAVPER